MSDNPLADIAGTFSSDLVNVYGGSAGNLIAYLPGGIPVPDYFVQDGVVNPTQVSEWLRANFDTPVLVRPGDVTICDHAPGYASEMYQTVVQGARPLGEQGSDELSDVASVLASAKQQYGDPGAQRPIGCTPLDWPIPTNTAYWSSFDSATASSSTSTTSSTSPTSSTSSEPSPPRVILPIHRSLWQLRDIATVVQPDPAPDPAPEPAPDPAPVVDRSIVNRVAVDRAVLARPLLTRSLTVAQQQEVVSEDAPSVASSAVLSRVGRRQIELNILDLPALQRARVVDDVTTTSDSSSLTISLDHTRVTLTRSMGGVQWWDDAFLGEPRWYLPGLPAGSKLPPPPPVAADDTGDPRVYALPVGLVLVRNLAVSGTWSADATQVLSSSGGLLGPFNLSGATITQDADGTTTYGCPGMQVVAILYAPLPVLPPATDPATVPDPAPADPPPTG